MYRDIRQAYEKTKNFWHLAALSGMGIKFVQNGATPENKKLTAHANLSNFDKFVRSGKFRPKNFKENKYLHTSFLRLMENVIKLHNIHCEAQTDQNKCYGMKKRLTRLAYNLQFQLPYDQSTTIIDSFKNDLENYNFTNLLPQKNSEMTLEKLIFHYNENLKPRLRKDYSTVKFTKPLISEEAELAYFSHEVLTLVKEYIANDSYENRLTDSYTNECVKFLLFSAEVTDKLLETYCNRVLHNEYSSITKSHITYTLNTLEKICKQTSRTIPSDYFFSDTQIIPGKTNKKIRAEYKTIRQSIERYARLIHSDPRNNNKVNYEIWASQPTAIDDICKQLKNQHDDSYRLPSFDLS